MRPSRTWASLAASLLATALLLQPIRADGKICAKLFLETEEFTGLLIFVLDIFQVKSSENNV